MSILQRKTTKTILLSVFLAAALLLPAVTLAEPENDGGEAQDSVTAEELHEEIERQIAGLDLGAWSDYFEGSGLLSELGFRSVDEMLLGYAEKGAVSDPVGILRLVKELVFLELKNSGGAVAALTAAALVTGLAGILPQKGMRPVLGFALSTMAVLAVSAAYSSLCSTASSCIRRTAEFSEAALPAMTALLSAVGAASSAGVFRPLMLFLSGSMISFIEKAVMPLLLAAGIVGLMDGLSGEGKLSSLRKLLLKTAKWLMGLSAMLYFAVCALQGMTVSAVDGISIRTAKYTLDRLIPSTNGLIGGSLDTFMSCALLVKNGVGAASVVIMLGILARPLIRIGAGIFVFRISAAAARPAASPGITKMLEGAADTASYLFGAAAVTGFMFIITVLVFVAAGGASAGLW